MLQSLSILDIMYQEEEVDFQEEVPNVVEGTAEEKTESTRKQKFGIEMQHKAKNKNDV